MWILIVAIFSIDGNAVSMQEFESEDTCNAAKILVLDNIQPVRYGKTTAMCTKK